MSFFQDLDETRSPQLPWGRSPEEFRAVGKELLDRESLFYADCTQFLWASVSGLLWTRFHPNLEKTTSSVRYSSLINLWQASLLKFWFVRNWNVFGTHSIFEIKLNPFTFIWRKRFRSFALFNILQFFLYSRGELCL